MRAWVVRGGRLQLDEVPDPSPGSDELVLKVQSVSLNRGELRAVARAADGFVPGWDVAGVVVSPAPNGSGPKVGQRVAALLPRGGWAELARVPSHHAAVVPDAVDLEVASTLPIAGLTVLRALAVAGNLLTKRVLVTAAAGGVGQLAVQLAARAGARVVAISSRTALHAQLRELGAAEVVPVIEQATGAFDLVLESVGGASFARAIDLLARGGTVVTIGNSSEQEATVNPRALYSKGGASIYGLLIFEEVESGRIGARELAALLALVAEGRLTSPISVRGPWTDLVATLEALERRAYSGKAVLSVG